MLYFKHVGLLATFELSAERKKNPNNAYLFIQLNSRMIGITSCETGNCHAQLMLAMEMNSTSVFMLFLSWALPATHPHTFLLDST